MQLFEDIHAQYGRRRIELETSHVVLVALLVATVVAGWQIFRGPQPRSEDTAKITSLQLELAEARKAPPTQSAAATHASPSLEEAIDAFLAKSDKVAKPGAIKLRDDRDGRGQYISVWDESVGPWPTATSVDGFTANQLRKLPRKFPVLKTQAAKDDLGAALKELSAVINKQAGTMVSKSQALRERLPPLTNMTMKPGYWDQPVNDIEEIQALWDDMAKFLQDEPILKDYPLYRAELAGTLPLPADQVKSMDNFKAAADGLRGFVTMMKSLQNIQDNGAVIKQASTLYPPIYREFVRATSDLQNWIGDCNRRIDMMLTAM